MTPRLEQQSLAERIAVGLGWFTVGVGVAELVMPAQIVRLAGIRPTGKAISSIRAMGVREIGSGLALVTRTGRIGAAAALTVTAADILRAWQLSRTDRASAAESGDAIRAAAAITISRPIAEVYNFWRNFDNFPLFMRNLESVRITGDRLSHWTVNGPAGLTAEWDAEIVSDQANHMISWRSVPGSHVENRGAVRFEDAPAGRGTEVHAELEYRPPAGRLGHAAAWAFGRSPRQQMREGLGRVKQMLEIGEILLSDGPDLSRPAQPPADPAVVRNLVGVES